MRKIEMRKKRSSAMYWRPVSIYAPACSWFLACEVDGKASFRKSLKVPRLFGRHSSSISRILVRSFMLVFAIIADADARGYSAKCLWPIKPMPTACGVKGFGELVALECFVGLSASSSGSATKVIEALHATYGLQMIKEPMPNSPPRLVDRCSVALCPTPLAATFSAEVAARVNEVIGLSAPWDLGVGWTVTLTETRQCGEPRHVMPSYGQVLNLFSRKYRRPPQILIPYAVDLHSYKSYLLSNNDARGFLVLTVVSEEGERISALTLQWAPARAATLK